MIPNQGAETMVHESAPRTRKRETLALLALLACMGITALFWAVRYAGWAIDGDAVRLSLAAEGMLEQGRLAPARHSYTSGPAFSATLAFVASLTGVEIQPIQLASSAWLLVVGLVAFVCYRELTGTASVAVLASTFLLLQPDFLFYILRPSHEKATWMFALLLLFLLVRSHRFAHQTAHLLVHVVSFYLVFWAMLNTNAFFASSFLFAVAFALLASRFLLPWYGRIGRDLSRRWQLLDRLLFVTLAGGTMVFLFINYAYEPALGYYHQLSTLVDRLSALLLGAQPDTRPFDYVQRAWRHPTVYLALTSMQWLIVGLSVVAWLRQSRRLARLTPAQWLLWLVYGGLALALALGTIVDMAGFLSANLQIRLFTPFTLVASPMAAGLVMDVARGLQRRARLAVWSGAGAIAAVAVVASLLKATNDPMVGNQWLFYSPNELEGLRWVERHVRSQSVWIDTFSHQYDLFSFWQGYDWYPANRYLFGAADDATPYVLSSRLTRLQANRSRLVLPSTLDRNRVYDNGPVQLFHRRPRTPYQR